MILRTIIVDDEADSVELLRLQLLKNCPQVEVVAQFTSSVKALQQIETLAPDLLFLDIEMPVMNGFELLDENIAPEFHRNICNCLQPIRLEGLSL